MPKSIINNAIESHLNAVETKFGKEAREKTRLIHQDGSIFILKRHNAKQPFTVFLGDLLLMTKHLQKNH